jgi:hypothetical protein
MRGFVAGTLVLIMVEVFTRRANVDKISGGTALLVSASQRLLSAGVAGIPSRAQTPAATAPSSGGGIPASAPQVGQTPTTKYV